MKVPEFPWYKTLESIDLSNLPLWLVCGLIGLTALCGLAYLIDKVLD